MFEVEEFFGIFVENVLIKVCYVVCLIGLLVLVDDFGVCVNVLGGVFGVYFVCYVGEFKLDVNNNVKFIVDLVVYVDKFVYYYCVLVYVCYVDDL